MTLEEILPTGKMALGKVWSKGREKEGCMGSSGRGEPSQAAPCLDPKLLLQQLQLKDSQLSSTHPRAVRASSVALHCRPSHILWIAGSLQAHSTQCTCSGRQVLPEKFSQSQASPCKDDLPADLHTRPC